MNVKAAVDARAAEERVAERERRSKIPAVCSER